MRKFIDNIIVFLIKTVIFLVILIVSLLFYVVFLSVNNDIAIEDTISYAKSFIGKENTDINYTNKNLVNFFIEDSNNATIQNSTNTIIQSYSEPNNSVNHFYYGQLDEYSKVIYNALNTNINNLKKDNYTIEFSNKFNELLNEPNGQDKLNTSFQSALDAFFYDHPELFYIDLTKISLLIQYTKIGPKTTYDVSLSPTDGNNYLHSTFKSEEEVNIAIAKVENIRNNIITNISATDDYSKALEVHDILVKLLEYDSSTSNLYSHNIYGALVNQNVVCEGYAKAYKYILDSLNINCILVSGTATNSNGETESHMWNYIKLNNNWYGVDVTWDDPIVVGGFTKNIIRHNYFCKGNNVFSKSHISTGRISDTGMLFSLPELSNENYIK